jgi:hypothetical protein
MFHRGRSGGRIPLPRLLQPWTLRARSLGLFALVVAVHGTAARDRDVNPPAAFILAGSRVRPLRLVAALVGQAADASRACWIQSAGLRVWQGGAEASLTAERCPGQAGRRLSRGAAGRSAARR